MLPRRIRPKFPEKWHVTNNPKLWITWVHANDKLVKEKVYWISTSSAKGRPHAAPVWGIWKQNRFYFETDPKSVKGRNILENQSLFVHVQDGLDTVIVDGRGRREKANAVLNQLRKDYVRKYDYRPDWSNAKDQIVFRVEPRIVHAWKAPRMHRSLVKFVF
jgi:hypothetical protein